MELKQKSDLKNCLLMILTFVHNKFGPQQPSLSRRKSVLINHKTLSSRARVKRGRVQVVTIMFDGVLPSNFPQSSFEFQCHPPKIQVNFIPRDERVKSRSMKPIWVSACVGSVSIRSFLIDRFVEKRGALVSPPRPFHVSRCFNSFNTGKSW